MQLFDIATRGDQKNYLSIYCLNFERVYFLSVSKGVLLSKKFFKTEYYVNINTTAIWFCRIELTSVQSTIS